MDDVDDKSSKLFWQWGGNGDVAGLKSIIEGAHFRSFMNFTINRNNGNK
jgi:hypothetical protein